MPDLGTAGVLVALIFAVQAIFTAISASRNRHLSARSKRLSRIEPAYLDAVDWIYQTQVWAQSKGQMRQLPPLPKSISQLALDEQEDMQAEYDALKQLEQEALRRQLERRNDQSQL